MNEPRQVTLSLARIAVVNRLRPVDPDWAEVIAASFRDRGQDQPIVVRPASTSSWVLPVGCDHILVAGAHRMAGAALVPWAEIRCEVQFLSDDEARLAEIDENLVRRELSVIDRALFLYQRKLAHEALYPETKHGGDRSAAKGKFSDCELGPGGLRLSPERFSKVAARKTGLSEASVLRAVEIGRDLAPEAVALVRDTGLARNATQLLLLARETPADQVRLATLIADGRARNVAAAKEAAGLATDAPRVKPPRSQERVFTDLTTLWEQADDATRRRFQAYLTRAGRRS